LNFCGEILQAVNAPRSKDHLATLSGKEQRGIFAKARRRARDENNFIF
jgi:hypothetical protein